MKKLIYILLISSCFVGCATKYTKCVKLNGVIYCPKN